MGFIKKVQTRYQTIADKKPSAQLERMIRQYELEQSGPDFDDERWGRMNRSTIEHRHNDHVNYLGKLIVKMASKEGCFDAVEYLFPDEEFDGKTDF